MSTAKSNKPVSKEKVGTKLLKEGFAKMQKGGVIMDVTTPDQARIAEESGAVAVMALERVPADIRAEGGVARMGDLATVEAIINAVTIPVMGKVRIGHDAEAQALQALGVDMIDESEVLTPADPFYHIDKKKFTVPFVCGCRALDEAVRRIWEGAAMIRTKGEAGTGNIVEAIRHQRMVTGMIRTLQRLDDDEVACLAELYSESYVRAAQTVGGANIGGSCGSGSCGSGMGGCGAGQLWIMEDSTIVFSDYSYGQIRHEIYEILLKIRELQRLPVVNFAAGGVATPADAAMMMQLGSDGVFVGSGIFKSSNPLTRAKAIVEAVHHYQDPDVIAQVSKNLGNPMPGIEIETLVKEKRLQERGW